MQSADRGIQDYPNELEALAAEDDTQGNGIFDPHGSQPNIHPDEGVFGDREGLPGYLAREQFFAPSEVLDVNTGKPAMYVPGNAFMMDPRTQHQLNEMSLYYPGLPSTGGGGVPQVPTVQPDQPGYMVPPGMPATAGLGQNNGEAAGTRTRMFMAAAVFGLGIGVVAGMVMRK
jgi:hypothetical protein